MPIFMVIARSTAEISGGGGFDSTPPPPPPATEQPKKPGLVRVMDINIYIRSYSEHVKITLEYFDYCLESAGLCQSLFYTFIIKPIHREE